MAVVLIGPRLGFGQSCRPVGANRSVARSLERVWEERLGRAEQVEQECPAWRREETDDH